MSLPTEISQYHSHHIRNLTWMLLSPPLIETQASEYFFPKSICLEDYASLQHEFSVIDQNDEQLGEFLMRNNHHRLGVYFERCCLYWLQKSKQYRLVAHNLAIRSEGRTLGEFDLLVEQISSGEIEHWELTIKFYLEVTSGRETGWLGPNVKDQLSRKFHHLVDRQLKLSENPVAQQFCEAKGWKIKHKRLLSRGRLFYRFNPGQNQPPDNVPDYISKEHLTGTWISHKEFGHYFEAFPQCEFFLLQKSEWMTPNPGTALTYSTLQKTLQTLTYPVQILVAHWKTAPQVLFLVPDFWHNEAQQAFMHSK